MKYLGFTLVETLIAIAILMLAITGPLYASSRAVDAAALSRNQLTASYLAQEGVEYIIAMRDNAYLTYGYGGSGSPTWWANDFLTSSPPSVYRVGQCASPATCTIDTLAAAGSELAVCGATCSPLKLSTRYNQTAGSTTIFTRTVTLDTIGNTAAEPEERVTVDVSWKEFGQTFHVTIRDHLTPWL